MANTAAAKKAMRQTKKRTVLNLAKKKRIKELTKETLTAIDGGAANVEELVKNLYKALDKAGMTNAIHHNKANRLKSRIQKRLNSKKK